MTLLLAIDDHSLPIRKHLCLHMSKPRLHPEPVVVPSPRDSLAPDNASAMFYGTVLHDPDHARATSGGPFRMWYHACAWGGAADVPEKYRSQLARYMDPLLMGPMCYAESHDGLTWTKPNVGQYAFKGSTQHNGLELPHILSAGVNIIRDDEDPNPARRYKLMYEIFPRYCEPLVEAWGKMTTVVTATSPDGLHWSDIRIPFRGQFIEQAGMWKHDGKYIIGYQAGDAWGSHYSDNGALAGRQGLARFATDFDHWVDGYVECFLLPEPQDPTKRGSKGTYDHVHIGVGAASFGNVCVGLYGLWHNREKFVDNSCDFGLVVSTDGLRFHEPVRSYVFMHATDGPAPQIPGGAKTFHTNLCQGNGILNVGDETRIYYGRWLNTAELKDGYYGDITLATLPRDRWAALALFPNQTEGYVWTMPLKVPARAAAFTLNAEHAAGLSVEINDEQCRPIAAYSGANAGKVAGDGGLNLPVRWADDALTRLAGQTVRFKIHVRKIGEQSPKLYAANL